MSVAMLILDMDGVLVDVRDSYHATIVETVRRFTGQEVPRSGVREFKARGGYNNDWKLSARWIRDLGTEAPYADVVEVFQEIYRGEAFDGLILEDRWLPDREALARMARRAELSIFTGRPREDAAFLLDRFGATPFFSRLVALEDVERGKPDPEGLLKILGGRPPESSLFAGDTVDDAEAARRAGVPFAGVVLPGEDREGREAALRGAGAGIIVAGAGDLEGLLS